MFCNMFYKGVRYVFLLSFVDISKNLDWTVKSSGKIGVRFASSSLFWVEI